jgi:hypothetical protein
MNFSSQQLIRPHIEKYALENINEAWQQMITNQARFRVVSSNKSVVFDSFVTRLLLAGQVTGSRPYCNPARTLSCLLSGISTVSDIVTFR